MGKGRRRKPRARQLFLPFPNTVLNPAALTEKYQGVFRHAVKPFVERFRRYGYSEDDLVQQAQFHLLPRLHHYDPLSGAHTTFIETYARNYLRGFFANMRKQDPTQIIVEREQERERRHHEKEISGRERRESRAWIMSHIHVLTPAEKTAVFMRLANQNLDEIGIAIRRDEMTREPSKERHAPREPSVQYKANQVLAMRHLKRAIMKLRKIHEREEKRL